ncbi:MAG: glycosyltransferase, partial [Candidatus Dormibacteraeota bacterium]|nr:glycosyltransferase [Candidatus Dormibacteraeota bacterium]
MGLLEHVEIAPLPPERYEAVITPEKVQDVQEAIETAQEVFANRAIWNVNSTSAGGGVAEMLRSLLAYARGAAVDARWTVIKGNADFFEITKRIHNHLHSFIGDGGQLGDAERQKYEAALKPNVDEFLTAINTERDIALLHDPQTAGMIPALKAAGVPVVWRCHVGIDNPDDLARNAWNFLRPYVVQADAYVFSRKSFVWEGLDESRTYLIAPSIDAFSPKNREMDPDIVLAVLAKAGLINGDNFPKAIFLRQDGTPAEITHMSEVYTEQLPDEFTRLVLQVSRWDALKDPLGVIQGFAEHIAPASDAHLMYAGPMTAAVSDDPEGLEVLNGAIALWRSLPDNTRRRVHLACLPMDDGEENAAMVNALQRKSTVVVQKSLAEGFGLTVAEAMWKARPVVASRVGGIQDQIVDGETGLLLDDPRDLAAYGAAVSALLTDRQRAEQMGERARERVRDKFISLRSLLDYLAVLRRLAGPA